MSGFTNFFATELPIYTTRPHGANKETAQYSQRVWITILAQVLVFLNVILWGIYGVGQAVGHIL